MTVGGRADWPRIYWQINAPIHYTLRSEGPKSGST